MNGVFDLAGTDGMGPVVSDNGAEPVFRAEWEKAAFAMFAQGARAGLFNIDEFRHCIEKMEPVEYLVSNYYEHWAHVLEHMGREKDLFDASEFHERIEFYTDNPDAPLPERADSDLLEFVNTAMKTGFSSHRDTPKEAAFKVGDVVTVASDSPSGHTRRAGYIRGRTGVIILSPGAYVYPDTSGNGLGECPEYVYTVKFTASELWGEETADPAATVCFDVWEPYISYADKTITAGV